MTRISRDLITVMLMFLIIMAITIIAVILLPKEEMDPDTARHLDNFIHGYTPTPRPLPTSALPAGTVRFIDHETGVVCYQTTRAIDCVPLADTIGGNDE